MLKLFILASLSIVVSLNLGAQTTLNKVEDFLGTQRFNELQNSNSDLIDYLTVKSEEGYSVNQSVEEKKSSYVQIEKVYYQKQQITIDQFVQNLQDESFNFLNYTFPDHDSNVTTHYLLGDTNILFTVYSNAALNKKVANR
tara:strand:- start:5425 stop:5847 length:423 start_codon:yes stop_codon:yes gene_type:complete